MRAVHAALVQVAEGVGQLLHERHGHVSSVLLLLLLLLAGRPLELLHR